MLQVIRWKSGCVYLSDTSPQVLCLPLSGHLSLTSNDGGRLAQQRHQTFDLYNTLDIIYLLCEIAWVVFPNKGGHDNFIEKEIELIYIDSCLLYFFFSLCTFQSTSRILRCIYKFYSVLLSPSLSLLSLSCFHHSVLTSLFPAIFI